MLTFLIPLLTALAFITPHNAIERVGGPYPLSICPLTGQAFPESGGVVVLIAGTNDPWLNGRELRVCCNNCAASVQSSPLEAVAKADALLKEDQRPHYPRTQCVVMSDRELPTAPGEAVEVVYMNRLVRLCCKRCEQRFHADPQSYLKTLDESAMQQQKATYPLDTCPVTGAPLGETAEAFLVNNTLIKTCCGGCKAKVLANPLIALSAVAAARIPATSLTGETALLPPKVLAALGAIAPKAEVLSVKADTDRLIVIVRTQAGVSRTLSISLDGWVLADSGRAATP